MYSVLDFIIRHPALFVFALFASLGLSVALVTAIYDKAVEIKDRRAQRKPARITVRRMGSEQHSRR